MSHSLLRADLFAGLFLRWILRQILYEKKRLKKIGGEHLRATARVGMPHAGTCIGIVATVGFECRFLNISGGTNNCSIQGQGQIFMPASIVLSGL
jgi:hypothetical protein